MTNSPGQVSPQEQLRAKRTNSLRALARMYGFSDADVRANSQGRLSESQRQRIQRKHFENSRYAWIGFAIVASLGFLGSGGAALRGGRSLLQMWLGVGVALSVVAAFVWAGILISRWKMHRMLRDGVVQQVDGVLRLHKTTEKHPSFYLVVDKESFPLLQYDHHQLFQAGVDGLAGSVYYTMGWRTVLSVELQP
jgi:hypothetical protein